MLSIRYGFALVSGLGFSFIKYTHVQLWVVCLGGWLQHACIDIIGPLYTDWQVSVAACGLLGYREPGKAVTADCWVRMASHLNDKR